MPTTDPIAPTVKNSHTPSRSKLTQTRDSQTAGGPGSAIDQACLLRETLHNAVQQANALVRELKIDRKRTKTLRSTLLSLKQLQAMDA